MPQCVVCEEAITNPVCSECLATEIRHWLVEKKPSLVPLFEEKADIFSASTPEGTTCILCNSGMNVCPHCLSLEVYLWLQEDYEDYAEEFLDLFNFELRECLA